MHLLIDGQALQTSSSRQRGIGRYSSNLLRALAVARPRWRIEVVQNSALAPVAADDLNGLPVLSFSPPLGTHSEQRELNERYYADWLTAQGADGVLVLSHCEGWEAVVPCFCGPRPRVFGIAYDLIPLLYPEHYLTDFGTAHWYAHRFRHLLRSDALLAISEATARDVRALGGSEAPLVVNVGGAVDPLFAPLSSDEFAARAEQVRTRFGLQRDFLLYVGATDYRKNLRGAIRAFGALSPDCRASLDLAVVCRVKPGERAAIEETARRAGVASSLRLICSAGDEDLRALYQMCRLFFFPSLYEGLGLPVLEALHCGAPVVTSDCSSLPEYAGPISWLGDPASPAAMARVLQEALAEPRDARRPEREAFARTFSWQRTAERACAVMERGMKRRTSPPRRRRRIAWVAPLSAAARDKSTSGADLLPRLAERFDIELIAGQHAIEVPETLSRHHLILTAREVPTRHAALPYDLFVYQLSPSPRHSGTLDLLRQFPGLVVLHDVSAADLAHLVERKLLSAPNGAAATPGLELLVHSRWAWQQARHCVGTPVVHAPLPLTLPSLQSSAVERAQLDLPVEGLLLCSLLKNPSVHRLGSLLQSVADLPLELRERLHLLLVNEGEEPPTQWLRLAAEHGLAQRVLWRTRISQADMIRHARAADVCVQLHDPPGGEMPLLLLALAAGAACIVSDLGSAADLPEDVVMKVRTPDGEREDLDRVMRTLLARPELRRTFGEAAARYIAENHDPRRIVAAYAAWIDQAIARHEHSDGLWRGFAVQCLADCADEAESVIDSWASLRARGQQQLAYGSPRSLTNPARASAA